MTSVLVDTCILVYAYEKSDMEKHVAAKEAIRLLLEEGNAAVSVQNLAEFSRVLSEKSKTPVSYGEARKHISEIASVFNVISYGAATVDAALSICSGGGTHFFDALLAATAEENGIYEIITENVKDFKGMHSIKASSPFAKKLDPSKRARP